MATTLNTVDAPPKSSGCGCCAGGCASLLAIGLVGLAAIVALFYFFYAKTINSLTSDAPSVVQMDPPTEAQYAAASAKFDQLRSAAVTKRAITVELTAADVNALIARHPSFTDMRGKFRVAIAQSLMTVDMSVPLRDVPLPNMRSRWFNGTTQLGLTYDEDQFALAIKSLEANGRQIDLGAFASLADWINRSANEGFERTHRQDATSNEFWDNVDSMRVVDDKLIITTKGDAAPSAAEPSTT